MANSFRELEERLQLPEVRRAPEEVGKLLAADFVEFGSSGAIYSRQQVIEGLAQEAHMERSVMDFNVRALSDDLALITYRATRRDPTNGQVHHSLRSSIWTLVDGGWQMLFHQGTPTQPLV
jgi:hypothetical protein